LLSICGYILRVLKVLVTKNKKEKESGEKEMMLEEILFL
jgi:hypothetical protein